MKKIYILFIVPFILYPAMLGIVPQMDPDETRYSLIASEMNESGNYVTPHLKHTVYLEKPPLVAWVTAVAFKVFGETDFSARLFAGLSAWGCIVLAFFMGRHFRDEKTGLFASAVLTISLFPFILGRINILDMPLAFFVCLAIWLGYLYLEEGRRRYLYLAYLSAALAFLIKGMIGAVLPAAVLFLWICSTRQWRNITKLISPPGIVIFLAVVFPWLYLVQKENKDFLWYFFVHEHFLRFATKTHGKTEPFYFFIPIILAGTLPWSVFLIRAWQPRTMKQWLFKKEENKLLAVWVLFVFFFYTVSSSKLAPYIAPVFVPLAVWAGSIFRMYEQELSDPSGRRMIFYRIAVTLQSLLLMLALLAMPLIKKYLDPSSGLVIMTSDCWWIYILPPLCGAILLMFLPDLVARKTGRNWFLTLYMSSCLLLAGMILPFKDFISPYRSTLVARDAIARYVPKDALLYQYRDILYGVDYYNKIRTAAAGDFGELGFGIIQLPPEERRKYFLYRDEFFARLENEKEVYCIIKRRERLSELQAKYPDVEILWDNGAFFLLKFKQSTKEK